MAVLLFRLRGVPEDEAGDIRRLLSEHDIAFYETDAGNWGISLPAIWLPDDEQLGAARALIDTYQQQRQQRARAAYEERRQRGEQRTIMNKVRESPLLAAIYLVAALAILYLTLMPFLGLIR